MKKNLSNLQRIETTQNPLHYINTDVPFANEHSRGLNSFLVDIAPIDPDEIRNTAKEAKEFWAKLKLVFGDGKVEFKEIVLVYKEAKDVVRTSFFQKAWKAIVGLFTRKR